MGLTGGNGPEAGRARPAAVQARWAVMPRGVWPEVVVAVASSA